MTGSSADRDQVEQLAEEFVARWRRGERPSVDEYANAHPNHGERIRRLFPAILLAENMGVPSDIGRPAPAPPPKALGEYRIVREIGRGGMGVVYEAVQEPLGRQVALKVLASAGTADPRYRERFHREARAAARLHHTNIVPVFGVGEHDGVPYYAMQFIAGQGMDQVIREVVKARRQAITDAERPSAPTSPALASTASPPAASDSAASSGLMSGSQFDYFRGVARVGLQVAAALGYAHEQGVVHRDIKPSNLLMDAAGVVWVTDFGLAKTEDDAGLTGTGDFVGTMRYMAPERFRGESGPACDIYSLGVTLYEMLTFRAAFDATDRAKLLDQVLRTEPTAPRSLDRRVPRDLETIVLKAMAKDPRHRYGNAQAMADDLHQFLADRPIAARRANWPERTWRWCRRNPVVAALSAGVAALALAILIASPIVSLRLYEQRQEALEKLWTSNLAQAKAIRSTTEAGRRFTGIASLDAANALLPSLRADPDRRLMLREEFIACLSLGDLGPVKVWNGCPEGTAAICFDPTLHHYARGDETGAISIRAVADDAELVKLPGNGVGAWGLCFNPDGSLLAAGYHRKYESCSEQFKVWDWRKNAERLRVNATTGCGDAVFSADGRFVAFGRDNKFLAIHDLVDPKTPPIEHSCAGLPAALAFHPDGRRIAVAVDKVVEIRDVESGEVAASQTYPTKVYALAWQPGGRMLAVAAAAKVFSWADDKRTALALDGHDQGIYGLAFNAAGDLLASKSLDGTVRLWNVETQRQLVRTASVYAGCTPLQFAGDRLAFGSDGRQLRLWDVAPGSECRTVTAQNQPANWRSASGDFSRDNRWLAVCGLEGFRIWEVTTGRLIMINRTPSIYTVSFLPGDRAILASGKSGLQSWPIETNAAGDFLKLGAARTLHNENLQEAQTSDDGKTIACRRRQGWPFIFRDDAEPKLVNLGEHPLERSAVLHPSGRVAATGTLFGKDARIWNAADGALLRELQIDSSAAVSFSPDGRWLVTATDSEYSFWDAHTWQRSHGFAKEPESTPLRPRFTADGSMMCARVAPTRLWLVDPSTGRRHAELQSPDFQSIAWHEISRDGKFVAAGSGINVHIWDIGRLRQQLAARQLDW